MTTTTTTASRRELVCSVLGVCVAAAGWIANVAQGAERFALWQAGLLVVGAVLWLVGEGRRRGLASAPAAALRTDLAMACAVALPAGMLESVMRLARAHVWGRGLELHPHVFWMAPVGNAIWFAGVTLVLRAVSLGWRPAAAAWTQLVVLVFIAALGVLSLIPGMYQSALVLVSFGVAARCATVGAAGRAALPRRLMPWFAGLCLALLVAVWGWRAIPERRAIAALPAAPRGAPNIVLVVWDTVRAQSLSLYGRRVQTTPNLERLAAGGVVFDRALATSPWTLPSHGSMFTGRLPHELFGPGDTPLNASTPLPDEPATLAEVLGGRGWLTGGFVANMSYCSYAHGLDRGFAHYEDHPVSLECLLASPWLAYRAVELWRQERAAPELIGRPTAPQITDRFVGWVDQQEAGRPFFAFLNYFDAHYPYNPAPEVADLAVPLEQVPAAVPGLATSEMMADFWVDYERCITYLDRELGRLVAALEARGVLENTLLIVTADHGEHFGEHGFAGHANTLFPQLLHVPLVLVAPGRVPAGVRVGGPVSLVDLAATALDVAGVQAGGQIPGVSLGDGWRGAASVGRVPVAEILVGDAPPKFWRPHYPGRDAGVRAVFADGYEYIRILGAVPVELLIHFDEDVRGEHLITNPEPQRAAKLRQQLEALTR